jgi:NADPH-dependent glutamate synthase beta subunit-like oxidoreductase
MKLDKGTVQRRVDLMAEEGVEFATNTDVGEDARELLEEYDALVLAIVSMLTRMRGGWSWPGYTWDR